MGSDKCEKRTIDTIGHVAAIARKIFFTLPNLCRLKEVYVTKTFLMRRAHLLCLLFLSLLFGCQKEVSFFGNPDNPSSLPAPDPIKAIVQGNILDETGQPAAGVMVQVGSRTATTDQKGYFRLTEAELDKKAALVTATKGGYHKAYRTFSATSGTNQVVIKLIKKTLAGTVSAASGGDVALSNGSKVTLPADGLVTASNNSVYTGTVNVYATYIDPTAPDISQIIPGSLLAQNKEGKRVLLVSYGMMAVELESLSGEKLQIKSGAKATLTTAIPAAVQNSAPATIPLWSVDETTGIWKEEGTATRNGAVYVGEVSHFSFWNVDVAQNTVTLSATVKNDEGNPLVNVAVRIKRTTESGVSFAQGYTDSLGQVSGYVPANEPLQLEVLDECGTTFYSQNIPAQTQSVNVGVITVTNTGGSVVTIKGKLLNCSNAPVTNGFAIITFDNKVRYAAANASGDFQTTFTRCASSPSTIDIVGVDQASQQQSNSTSVNVTAPLTNAGTISACGLSSEEFIDYTIDGVNYRISSTVATDSLTAFTTLDSAQVNTRYTFFSGIQVGRANNITMRFRQAAAAGTYPLDELMVQSFQQTTVVAPFNVTLTSYPQTAGLFYEGSFTGSFRDAANTSHTLSGTFRLRRVF